MTIIMNIQSARTGIRHTEVKMDIQITKHHNSDKRNICGISPLGTAWIFKYMDDSLKTVVVVDKDAVPDLIDLMEKDGLTVSER